MNAFCALLAAPFFLCWGSWLNVVAYRLVRDKNPCTGRSHCPHCNAQLKWYHNIPVISWLMLRSSCAFCKAPISWLYPFIELLTLCTLLMLMYLVPADYFFAYFLFFSALMVTIRSDLETMLISRFVTLFLVPFGIALCAFNFLPLPATTSIVGAIFGYGILWSVATAFYYATGKVGMGEGDFELLAFIGAFTGPVGVLVSILIASLVGSLIGSLYLFYTKQAADARIPFGPFLAAGAMIFVLFQHPITLFLFGF